MRVLVGGVTSENGHVGCVETFLNIRVRPGDERKLAWRGRGDASRSDLAVEFLSRKEFDALFLCDVDMAFKPGVLERLRGHDLEAVSGHYFRRRFNPMVSIATVVEDGKWPYFPLWDIPDDGLLEVTTVGFGCVLIKRHVLEMVQASLPPGTPALALGPLPEMTKGDYSTFGSDYRFWAIARKLGFKVWLDCNIEAEAAHAATVFLTRELYTQVRGWQAEKAASYWKTLYDTCLMENGMDVKSAKARVQELELHLRDAEMKVEKTKADLQDAENRVKVLCGQLAERRFDLQPIPGPEIHKLANVPVFESKEAASEAYKNRLNASEGMNAEEVKEGREGIHRKIAQEFVDAVAKDNPQG